MTSTKNKRKASAQSAGSVGSSSSRISSQRRSPRNKGNAAASASPKGSRRDASASSKTTPQKKQSKSPPASASKKNNKNAKSSESTEKKMTNQKADTTITSSQDTEKTNQGNQASNSPPADNTSSKESSSDDNTSSKESSSDENLSSTGVDEFENLSSTGVEDSVVPTVNNGFNTTPMKGTKLAFATPDSSAKSPVDMTADAVKKVTSVNIHPSMFPFISLAYVNDEGGLTYGSLNVNHSDFVNPICQEIVYNAFGNPRGRVEEGKPLHHECELRSDMILDLACIGEVRYHRAKKNTN